MFLPCVMSTVADPAVRLHVDCMDAHNNHGRAILSRQGNTTRKTPATHRCAAKPPPPPPPHPSQTRHPPCPPPYTPPTQLSTLPPAHTTPLQPHMDPPLVHVGCTRFLAPPLRICTSVACRHREPALEHSMLRCSIGGSANTWFIEPSGGLRGSTVATIAPLKRMPFGGKHMRRAGPVMRKRIECM